MKEVLQVARMLPRLMPLGDVPDLRDVRRSSHSVVPIVLASVGQVRLLFLITSRAVAPKVAATLKCSGAARIRVVPRDKHTAEKETVSLVGGSSATTRVGFPSRGSTLDASFPFGM